MLNKYPIELGLTRSQKILVKDFNSKISAGEVDLEIHPCIICDENRPILIFENDSWGISNRTCYCEKCGLVYTNPRMSEDCQNEFYISDTYRQIYEPKTEISSHISIAQEKVSKIRMAWGKKSRKKGIWFLDELLVNANIQDMESICEIGSGSGANLIPFIDSGIDCYGVELSPSLTEFSETLGVLGTYKTIEDINKNFDIILMIHSLEHMYDPIKTIKKLRKHTKKFLVVEIPGIVNRVSHVVNAHNFYFSKQTLQALMAGCGFKCVSIQTNPENNFILGIFEPSDIFAYEFSYKDNLQMLRNIIVKQKILNMVPIFLKRVLGSLVKNLWLIFK